MLPIIIGAGLTALVAAGAKMLFSEDEQQMTPPEVSSILSINLYRLNKQIFKLRHTNCILVLGQPGSGKSSLLYNLTDGKIIPQVIIGQKTDSSDWASNKLDNLIYEYDYKYFVDMPGYGTYLHDTNEMVDNINFQFFKKIVFVVKGKINEHDIYTFKKISIFNPIIVRTFAEDLLDKERDSAVLDIKANLSNYAQILLMSNRTKMNLKELKNKLNIS